MARRFELVDGKSSKFWEIEQVGTELNISWGRIGTNGQQQTKSFDTDAKATVALGKLVTEKTGKGYAEVVAGVATAPASAPAPVAAAPVAVAAPAPAMPAPAAPAPVAAPITAAAPVAAAPVPTSDATVPPWLAGEPPLIIPAGRETLGSRRFPPEAVEPLEPKSIWLKLREALVATFEVDVAASEAALQPDMDALVQRLQSRKIIASPKGDAQLLAILLGVSWYHLRRTNSFFFDWLVANSGLVAAVQTYLDAQAYEVKQEYSFQRNGPNLKVSLSTNVSGDVPDLNAHHWRIRHHLSLAPEAEWQACVDLIRQQLPHLHPARQPLVAVMLPDLPELSNELALGLGSQASPPESLQWLQLTATSPEAIAASRKAAPGQTLWHSEEMVATLVQERGLDALDVLKPWAQHTAAGTALAFFGLPDAVEALARVASTSKEALARFSGAVTRWPAASIAALSHLVALGGKDATLIAPSLMQLMRAYPALVQAVRPWIEPAANATLDRLQARLDGPAEVAADADLPSVLVAPPWLAKKQKKAFGAMALEPLALAPVEQWGEGEREQILGGLSKWEDERMARARANHRTLLDELGFDFNRTGWSKGQGGAAEAAWKAQDARALADAWFDYIAQRKKGERYFYMHIRPASLTCMPAPMGVEFWNLIAGEGARQGVGFYGTGYAWASFGLAALPALTALASARPSEYLGETLPFGAVEFAPMAARAFAKLKSLRETGRQWLLRFPDHAIAGLIAPALGKAGEARDCAAATLRMLASRGHDERIMAAAARYGRDDVVQAVRAVLDESPLDRFPTKRAAAMPAFWLPQGWQRPVLRSNGAALPDSALAHLGQMLTFPTNEEVYGGIALVKEACTPESLAAFMWDCFSAWLNAGAPSKDGWALTMLGRLGSDDTARKLTPYIRAWPGEASHARAVTGLDVLANIGSDVALMLLNGIAQKVAFKGLQDKAREKIQAIADDRGLTTEELEDRLAPDLGLDEQGTLVLDFGPRQFKVGFDEALKPFVRERVDGRDGPRLPDLPKPKKTDDEALGKAAVERFKLLKKDARTIASQQVLRLEVAMCGRRRWTREVFQQFLVEHPLVRHLVQRLVWGVYACEPDSSHGGTLQACFRVSEDGSFTDAQDDAWELPDGDHLRIGVPHALELPAEDAAGFGQLFADYELLQPFVQIGRDTYALTEAERGVTELLRWKDVKVPTGRVLGLTAKGWRRGQAQDGGGIWYFSKPLGRDRVIELTLDPGIIVGMVDEYPEQALQEVHVGKPAAWGDIDKKDRFELLDAIAASELIRDLEALRA